MRPQNVFRAGRMVFLTLAFTAMAALVFVPTPAGDQAANGHFTDSSRDAHVVPSAITRPVIPLYFEQRGESYFARGTGYELLIHKASAGLALESETPSTVRISPAGGSADPKAEAENTLPGHSSYYSGSDPSAWQTGIEHVGRVLYPEVYPGVDLVYYGTGNELEFDFVVDAGADPGRIGLSVDGASAVRLSDQGDLLLDTPAGVLRQRKPVAYQEGPEGRTLVAAAYQLDGKAVARFELGEYDASRPLVIDPILDYSTYVGGNGLDDVTSVDFDSEGNIIICGINGSSQFPAGSQLTPAASGYDAYLMKLTPDAQTVLFRAQVGGTGNDVSFIYCKAQPNGGIVMTGQTEAQDFPLLNPIQNSFGGGETDVFVTRFNNQGGLTFSTYLGGADYEGPSDVAFDSLGNFFIAGWTASSNFPRQNSIQPQFGGVEDGFITKYSASGGAMIYSTLFGGSGLDYFNALALDDLGAIYGVGYTESNGLLTPVTAYQRNLSGAGDAFALKLDPTGAQQLYFTYLGGSDYDSALAAAVDAGRNLYIGGHTYSNDFPVASIQANRAGAEDTFVTKLNTAGSGLVYSTYLGGSAPDRVERVKVNRYNELYVTGWTESVNFPVVNASQAQKGASEDAFLYKVNAAGSGLVYSTFLGGSSLDEAWGLAIDSVGGIVAVSGYTEGPGFPTANPVQPGYGGDDEGFLSIFVEAVGTSAASYARGELTPHSIGAVFGAYFASGSASAGEGSLPTSLLGAKVTITDSEGTSRDCGLFFVAGGPTSQINFLVHPLTELGPAVLTVTTADGLQYRGAIEIVGVVPGLFSQDSSGSGVAAANVARLRNGQFTYTFAGEFEGGMWVPEPIDLGPETDQVFLYLYGTGIRAATTISAQIDGIPVTVVGPVAQGEFIGLDQMNLGPLPRALIGRGVVNITITLDGRPANVLTVAIH